MNFPVDVWLRGSDAASTETVEGIANEPSAWTDDDVRAVLMGMLRVMDLRKSPGNPAEVIQLRGISWIVNPFEEGGVVIAIEIGLGAAVAGPFDIDKAQLEGMLTRVLTRPVPPASTAVH